MKNNRPEDFLNSPFEGLTPIAEVAKRVAEQIINTENWLGNQSEYALRGDREWYRNVYLKSDHWRDIRSEAITIARHECQLCGASEEDCVLDVHHLTYERLGFELPDDVIVMCRNCHNEAHRP